MRELIRSLVVLVVMSLLTGVIYPLIITGIAKAGFRYQAQGSLLKTDGKIVGSTLVGQYFSSPNYFHGRPSAIDKAYDAGNSGGSNFGPSNRKFIEDVSGRIEKVRKDNRLESSASVPADLVLASASGLDPHISIEGATIQIKRIAKVRGIHEPDLQDLIERSTETPLPVFFGQKRINVLKLNLALDELSRRHNRPESPKPDKRG